MWQYILYIDAFENGVDISEDLANGVVARFGGTAATTDFLIKIPNIVISVIDEYGENPFNTASYYQLVKQSKRVYLDITYDGTLLFRGYASKDVLKTYTGDVNGSEAQLTDISFFHIFDILSQKIVNFKTSTLYEISRVVRYIIENAISSTRLYEMTDLTIYEGDPANSYAGAYVRGKFAYDKVYLPLVPMSSPEGYLQIGHELVRYGSRRVEVIVENDINVYYLQFMPYPGNDYRADLLDNSDRAQFGTLPEYYTIDKAGILKMRPYGEVQFDAELDLADIFENTSDSEQEQRFGTVICPGTNVYQESDLKDVVAFGTRGTTLYRLKTYDTTEIVSDNPTKIDAPVAPRRYSFTDAGDGNYNFLGYTTKIVAGQYISKLKNRRGFVKHSMQQNGERSPLIASQFALYNSAGKHIYDAVALQRYYGGTLDLPHRFGILPKDTAVSSVFYYYGKTSLLSLVVPNPCGAPDVQAQAANMIWKTSSSLIADMNFLTPVSESTGKGLVLVLMKNGTLSLYECVANDTGAWSVEAFLAAGTLLWTRTDLSVKALSQAQGVLSTNDLINHDIAIYKFSYIDTSNAVKMMAIYASPVYGYAIAQDYNNETLYTLSSGCDVFAGFLSAYYVVGVPYEEVEDQYSHFVRISSGVNYYVRKKLHVNELVSVDIKNKKAIDVLNNFRKLYLAFMYLRSDNTIVIRSLRKLFDSYVEGSETAFTTDDVDVLSREAFNVQEFTPGEDFLSNDYLSTTFDREKTRIFSDYSEVISFVLQRDIVLDYFSYISLDNAIGVVIGVEVQVDEQSALPIVKYTAIMRKTPDILAMFGAL